MTTVCTDCKHVYRVNKKDPPWRWLCLQHKRMDGFGFVTNDQWDDFPPYLYCKDVNGGACPLFAKDSGKQLELRSSNYASQSTDE